MAAPKGPTLDEVLDKVGISEDTLDQECSERNLPTISNDLDWRKVAPHLGLNKTERDDIDYKKTEPEKRVETLQKWKSKLDFNATYRVLVDALLKTGNTDQARKVCQLLKQQAEGSRAELSPSSLPLSPESTSGSVSGSYHEGLIPQGQTDTNSRFPYLNTGELSSQARLALECRLLKDSTNIMSEFGDLKVYTIESIASRGISVEKLYTGLSSFGAYRSTRKQVPLLQGQLDKLERAKDVDAVFCILDKYYSFFNYGILEKLIGWFGTEENKARLQTYTENFKRFCKRRTFECPPDIFGHPVDKGKTNLVVKVEESWDPNDGCPVETVLRLRISLADILEVEPETLNLCRIDKGCVELLFQVPSFVEEDIFPLSMDQERSLTAVGVTRIACGSYRFPQSPEVREHEEKREVLKARGAQRRHRGIKPVDASEHIQPTTPPATHSRFSPGQIILIVVVLGIMSSCAGYLVKQTFWPNGQTTITVNDSVRSSTSAHTRPTRTVTVPGTEREELKAQWEVMKLQALGKFQAETHQQWAESQKEPEKRKAITEALEPAEVQQQWAKYQKELEKRKAITEALEKSRRERAEAHQRLAELEKTPARDITESKRFTDLFTRRKTLETSGREMAEQDPTSESWRTRKKFEEQRKTMETAIPHGKPPAN